MRAETGLTVDQALGLLSVLEFVSVLAVASQLHEEADACVRTVTEEAEQWVTARAALQSPARVVARQPIATVLHEARQGVTDRALGQCGPLVGREELSSVLWPVLSGNSDAPGDLSCDRWRGKQFVLHAEFVLS